MPDVGQVAREATGHDEYGVDPDNVAGFGKTMRQAFRSHCNPAQSILVERPGGRIRTPALLHLDEGDRSAAASDQVYFTARYPSPPSENLPALETQPPCSDRFRPTAASFG